MIKKTLIALFSLGTALTSTAQIVKSVEVRRAEDQAKMYRGVVTNPFKSNWEVGASLGGQIYFGDHDKMMNFGERLNLNLGAKIGKWFTPGLGVRLGVVGGNISGVSGWTGHSLNGPNENWNNYQGFIVDAQYNEAGKHYVGKRYDGTPAGHYDLFETSQQYINIHGDVLLNLSNMLGGYNPERTYSFIPFASAGFATSLNNTANGIKTQAATLGLGLLNRIRLSQRLDLDIEGRITYTGDQFDGEYISSYIWKGRNTIGRAGRWGEGIVSVGVGVNYRLGTYTWEHCEGGAAGVAGTAPVRLDNDIITELQERLGDENFRRQLESALQGEVTRESVMLYPLLVTFEIDKWELRNMDRVNLGFLADALKANPGVVFKVTGYADAGTGSVERNIFLARMRSEVIYNCLVKEFGVPASQLQREDMGGVQNMYYNDPRCSRAVLLKAK